MVGKGCRCFEYRVLPFGTLLGPEITGPYELTIVMVGSGTGSCCFWLFLRRPKAFTVNTWGVRGVTGLLFENYIVDASILKLLSAISDKPGSDRCFMP